VSPLSGSTGVAFPFSAIPAGLPLNRGSLMPSNIIYIIGLVVVVLAVLAFFGFR